MSTNDKQAKAVNAFAEELRKRWPVTDTDSWQAREDFINEALPGLLSDYAAAVRKENLPTASRASHYS